MSKRFLYKHSDNVIRIQDKGFRFVILEKQDYVDKMLGQLNNTLHYNQLSQDPTIVHLEWVKAWSLKWKGKGQITSEIANWVVNVNPKPGAAFGNVKTHKINNPRRLITSCCGTAIERLSSFTELYLKPQSQNLPSIVKDTTDLLNKLAKINEKGPFPEGTLLVSWDVVATFPNIDDKLGLKSN